MKPLLIHVEDIHTAAQPWEAAVAREELDEALLGDHPTEFHAGGSANVHAKLTRMGKKVLVQAKLLLPLTGSCKRCLKDVELTSPVELTLTYQPQATQREERRAHRDDEAESKHARGDKHGKHEAPEKPGKPKQDTRHEVDEEGAAGSFDFTLADEETYSGTNIDFAPALREQIILALPPSPLCSEACKGLCAICGQDKNLRDCGCAEARIDPRWEALKALQLSAIAVNTKASKE